jgi:hypothetical protein
MGLEVAGRHDHRFLLARLISLPSGLAEAALSVQTRPSRDCSPLILVCAERLLAL